MKNYEFDKYDKEKKEVFEKTFKYTISVLKIPFPVVIEREIDLEIHKNGDEIFVTEKFLEEIENYRENLDKIKNIDSLNLRIKKLKEYARNLCMELKSNESSLIEIRKKIRSIKKGIKDSIKEMQDSILEKIQILGENW